MILLGNGLYTSNKKNQRLKVRIALALFFFPFWALAHYRKVTKINLARVKSEIKTEMIFGEQSL